MLTAGNSDRRAAQSLVQPAMPLLPLPPATAQMPTLPLPPLPPAQPTIADPAAVQAALAAVLQQHTTHTLQQTLPPALQAQIHQLLVQHHAAAAAGAAAAAAAAAAIVPELSQVSGTLLGMGRCSGFVRCIPWLGMHAACQLEATLPWPPHSVHPPRCLPQTDVRRRAGSEPASRRKKPSRTASPSLFHHPRWRREAGVSRPAPAPHLCTPVRTPNNQMQRRTCRQHCRSLVCFLRLRTARSQALQFFLFAQPACLTAVSCQPFAEHKPQLRCRLPCLSCHVSHFHSAVCMQPPAHDVFVPAF